MHSRQAAHLLALTAIALIASGCRDSLGPSGNRRATRAATVAAPHVMNSVSVSSRRIPDQYIVVFDESVSDVHGRAAALAAVTGGRIRFEYQSAIRGFSANMSAQAAAALEKHPGVDYVEQDQEIGISEAAASWGIDRIDQTLLPLDNSYSSPGSGAGVHAYIIDSGIRTTHQEFGGRAFGDFSAIVDSYGATGCHWHGTHVAGTVGGSSVGVARGVTLHSVRVLDCMGLGNASNLLAGIDWVAANRVRPAVANISIVGGISTAINDAVQRLIESGVVVAVAAGNGAADACAYSPASAANALTVGATTNVDAMASYSNWGGCVDLLAPGSGINSAMNHDDFNFALSNGTSMAAPHVAGAAALYLQASPSASPAEVANAILANTTTGVVNTVQGTPNRLLRVGTSGGGEADPVTPLPPPSTNRSPIASFGFSCRKGACKFDASASSDDFEITGYAWSFGDGASSITAASPFVSHTYVQRGNYSVTVTLTVIDGAGLTGTTQKSIAIRNNGK